MPTTLSLTERPVRAGRRRRPRGVGDPAARVFLPLLVALVLADAALMLLHLGHAATWSGVIQSRLLASPLLNFAAEHGAAETWEYGKSAATALAAGWLFWKERQPIYAALSAAHAWLAFDNALGLHEAFGARLGAGVPAALRPGLIPEHAGELIFFVLFGALAAAVFAAAIAAGGREHRRLGTGLAVAFFSLGLFAVGMDVLHALPLFSGAPGRETAFVLLEDGGESLVLSFNAALTIAFAVAGAPRPRRIAS